MSDKELREAAEWYEQEGRGRSWYMHARTLAEWATSELSRRDAERAERAKPITEESLRDRSWLPDDGGGLAYKIWEVGQDEDFGEEPAFHLLWSNDSLWIECYAVSGDTLGLIELLAKPTIGQLDDLIAALKGGGA